MTQSQHTPGPWTSKGCAVTTSDPFTTFFTKESRCTDGTQIANAHLIAASPDMLKVLEGVLHHNDAVKEAHKLPNSLIREIVAALAKAKGYPADGVRGDVKGDC
jgi:hypothetical protein